MERAKLDYSAKDDPVARGGRTARACGGRRRAEAARGVGEARLERPGRRPRPRQAGVEAKREKSQFDLDQGAAPDCMRCVVRAPSDGIVTILRNWRSGNWMNPQEFKEGDRVVGRREHRGAARHLVALRLGARGRDRARPPAARPARHRAGRGACPTASSRDTSSASARWRRPTSRSWPPPRNFDVNVALDDHDDRLRPGMTANDPRRGRELAGRADGAAAGRLLRRRAATSSTSCRMDGSQRRHVEIDRRNADHVRDPDRRGRRRTRGAEGADAGGAASEARATSSARSWPSRLVGGAAAVFGVANLTPVPDRIPTTRPTRGDIDVRVHTMGELGPRRSMTLAAPSVGGTAADRHAGSGRQRRQRRRRRASVRPRRAAVQPAAGRVGAGRGRAGDRQAEGRRAACRRRPTS